MKHEFCIVFDFVEDWFNQTRKKHLMVDAKSKAIFLSVFEIFEAVGPIAAREKLPRTRTKFLFDGIWEIRVEQFRVAYFWHDSTCVLLHGIKKKQDKWIASDIQVVQKNKALYLDIHEGELA